MKCNALHIAVFGAWSMLPLLAKGQDGIQGDSVPPVIFGRSFGIGFGLGSPGFERSVIHGPVLTGGGGEAIWNNAFTNLGRYPMALTLEVTHLRPAGMSLTLGGSYAPSGLMKTGRSGISSTRAKIWKYRGYGKVLWSPRVLRITSDLQTVVGTLFAVQCDRIDAPFGDDSWMFHQRAVTYSWNGVAGLFLREGVLRFGLEAELLFASNTQVDWQVKDGSFYHYGPDFHGSESQWLDPVTAIETNYFVRTITARIIWMIPGKAEKEYRHSAGN